MLKFFPVALCAIGLSFLSSGQAHGASTAEAATFHSAESEEKCLADNVYFEARNQSAKGMIGVALVTRNRVNDSRFPHSYCEVVKQGPTKASWKDINVEVPIRHRCQFSWYCDGKSDDIPYYDIDVYQFARTIAFKVYHGDLVDFTEGATHYHANYVNPEWAETKTMTVVVDDHIFYRWEK